MSDEFDSPDASEKAAVECALNNPKRPSDDVVEVSIYERRHLRKHRRLLPLQAGGVSAIVARPPNKPHR